MIARLTGRVVRRAPGRLVLDVGGVGYEVHIPLSTFYVLPPDASDVTLEIHTHVREDAIVLYGFATASEKALFEKLIGVSGVGPRMACTLLSGKNPQDVVAAVRAGDPVGLQGVPGIGRKTAERIVLELRDRLEAPVGGEEAVPAPARAESEIEDAVSALENLGYRRPAAREAVTQAARRISGAAGRPDLEALLRQALQFLSEGAVRA